MFADASTLSWLLIAIVSGRQYIDEIVGRVLSAARPGALVILLSDHGFGPGLGRYATTSGDFLSGNHREDGVLIVAGGGAQHDVEQVREITHYDVLPTLLWLAGLPQADDLRGRPLVEYLDPALSPYPAPRRIESYGTIGSDTDAAVGPIAPNAEEEKILEELRSLGYLEGAQ